MEPGELIKLYVTCIIFTIPKQTNFEYIFRRNCMVYDETKKIIIVKNIPSNLIEEAILILKGNPKKEEKNSKGQYVTSEYKKNQYIIKEAEEVIKNCVYGKKSLNNLAVELNLKPSFFRLRMFANTIVNIVMLGSIVLLILMVAKLL